MRRLLIVLLLITILFPASGSPLLLRGSGTNTNIIYVATTGNDSNAGTISSPYLTIGKAQSAAQTALAAGKCPLIYFRGGTYPLNSTLSFGSSDSGTVSCTVNWNSFPGEYAIWSGGTVLTGTFTLCTTADSVCNSGSGGVYQSSVALSAFRELYVNGTHRTRVRGASNPSGWTATTGGYTSPIDMSSWGNPTNIEIVTTNNGWWQSRCTVASISGTSITMATPCWTLYKAYLSYLSMSAPTPLWVENAYELLPTCGQGCWYYNRTTQILYYIPENGENISTVSVIAPQLVGAASFNGASYITFSRLQFSYVTWNPDSGGDDYVERQNGTTCRGSQSCTSNVDTLTPMGAAFTLTNSTNHISFSHDLFTHIGGRSIYGSPTSQNLTVEADWFTDNGGGAVQWGAVGDYAQSNPALQTSGLLFENSQVDQPFEYQTSGGFYGSNEINSTIDHNTFTATPWAPLTLGEGWGSDTTYNANNLIADNWIKAPCQSFSDCGDIYTNNNESSSNGLTETGNYAQNTGNTGMQACFYLDAGSTYNAVTGNVCDPGTSSNYWVYLPFSSVQNNTVTNNWTTLATQFNGGTNNTISGTVTYTSGSPPAGAAAVIANAGIQSGVTPGP